MAYKEKSRIFPVLVILPLKTYTFIQRGINHSLASAASSSSLNSSLWLSSSPIISP